MHFSIIYNRNQTKNKYWPSLKSRTIKYSEDIKGFVREAVLLEGLGKLLSVNTSKYSNTVQLLKNFLPQGNSLQICVT